MVIRPAPCGPVILPLALLDGMVVDARDAALHEAVFIELPVLVAVGAEPLAGVVVPLVGEADGDAVFVERPHLFDEPVVEFLRPFTGEELHDGFAAGEELGAISPSAIGSVGECYP